MVWCLLEDGTYLKSKEIRFYLSKNAIILILFIEDGTYLKSEEIRFYLSKNGIILYYLYFIIPDSYFSNIIVPILLLLFSNIII